MVKFVLQAYPIYIRVILPLLLAAAAIAHASDAPPLAGNRPSHVVRPNIVLIIIDTLRADKLGCYGFPEDTSPELDAMARTGVQFRNVVAQCSWTRPSIGSMLTSCSPRTLGLYKEQNEVLNDRFVTLAEALRAYGYTTFGITANPVLNRVYGMDQGFQKYIDSNVIFSWMKSQVKGQAGLRLRRNAQLSSANEVFDRILEYAGSHAKPPCFVEANIMEMHESWRGRKSLTRPEFHVLFKRQTRADYLRALRQVSCDVNAFVRRLSALPNWGNTLFIITSDHGQGLNDHPHVALSFAHGRLLYESHVKVPLILYSANGALPPNVIERPVRLLDLMPTVLDYVGAPIPGQTEGASLVPLLLDKNADVNVPEILITETDYRHYSKIGAYSTEWKYFEHRDHPRHHGLREQELQRIGVREDGVLTDVIRHRPEIAEPLRVYLHQWEAQHPKAPPTPCSSQLQPEALEQLKAIGYLK